LLARRAIRDTASCGRRKISILQAFSSSSALRPVKAASEAGAFDATAEVAGPQETYIIGTIDWSIVDASGTPEATLAHCQTRLAEHRPPEIV
jgi:uncharacterized protein